MTIFKVWDVKREKKVVVVINGEENIYVNLLLKASEKLDIDGSVLVLESDGTVVDEDEALKELHKEVLILLTKSERWLPVKSADLSLSTCSTVTMSSDESLDTSSDATHHSDTSTSLSDPPVGSSKHQQISDSTWQEFAIPWQKMSKDVITNCERGIRNKQSLTEVVHVVCNSMREVKQFIPAKAFKIVAQKLVNRYPEVFKDKDEDGTILGDGTHTIYWKLQERNNYLNRPHKRPSSSSLEMSPKNIKKILSARSGCTNWQPLTSLAEENPETLEEKKKFLNCIRTSDFNMKDDVLNCLEATYIPQRTFLNEFPKSPTIHDIRREWPVLLIKPVIFWHFSKLLSIDLKEVDSVINSKVRTILQFGLTNEYITKICTEQTQKYMQMMSVIGNFFKEDSTLLITAASEVSGNDELNNKPPIKEICAVYSNGDGSDVFTIYVENESVLECDNILDTLKVVFALYYNFNIKYPKNVSHILEFMQRYFYKINPDQGTKSGKKSIKKIVSFINKLKDVKT